MKYIWEQFDKDSNLLSKVIKRKGLEFDYVCGIARGGLSLASKLGYLLDLPVICISCQSYKDKKQNELELISDNKIYNKRILLVDDISDTGNTLKKIKQLLISRKNHVISATLHVKPKTKFIPYFYITKTNKWVKYPWEK